jgi:hypothetical protein
MNHQLTNWRENMNYGMPYKTRAKAKQEWAIGATVNVGFVKCLLITEKTGFGWNLVDKNGKRYSFEPHRGLFS